MTYEEALAYIHSVSWLGSRPGLERITQLMHLLGDPQNNLRFIHVAGTNGKGSVCVMLSHILTAAGHKTGLFTSPYVRFFNERMMYNNTPITNEELAEITAYVKPFADSMQDSPTEFELITAIGFVYFARKQCDYVVLECGMGGRLDSTNVITTSVLSIITGVALDHTKFLGDTVEKIAAEKAGIIKPRVPVLFGGNDSNAAKIISLHAEAIGAPYYETDRSMIHNIRCSLTHCTFDYKLHIDQRISLIGVYQPYNAAVVLDAISILQKEGILISDFALQEGLLHAKWPARFEVLSQDPPVVYDGAHNPEGIGACIRSISKHFPNLRVLFLTGIMADKDYASMVFDLSRYAKEVFTVTPDNPRAMSAETYAQIFQQRGIPATSYHTVEEGLQAAYQTALKTKRPLIIVGSLYMYAEIREAGEKLHLF